MAGMTAVGMGRNGWYHGFHLLVISAPDGIITGFGFGPANVNERALTETALACRGIARRLAKPDQGPSGGLVCTVGTVWVKPGTVTAVPGSTWVTGGGCLNRVRALPGCR